MSFFLGNFSPNNQRTLPGNRSLTTGNSLKPAESSNQTLTADNPGFTTTPPTNLNGVLSSIGNFDPGSPTPLSANPLFNQGGLTGTPLTGTPILGSSQSGIFSFNGLQNQDQPKGSSPGEDPLELGQFNLYNPGLIAPNGQNTPTVDLQGMIQRQKETNDTIKKIIMSVLQKRKEKADAAKAEQARLDEQRRKDDAAKQAVLEKAQAAAEKAKVEAEKAKAEADSAKAQAERDAAAAARKPPEPPPAQVAPAKPTEPAAPRLPNLPSLPSSGSSNATPDNAASVPGAQLGFGSASARR